MRTALSTLEANDVRVAGASDHAVTHSLYITDPDVPGIDRRNDPSVAAAPITPLML